MGKKRTKEGRHTAVKVKKLLQMLCLAGFIIFPTLIHAQQQSNFKWTNVIPWVIGVAGVIIIIYYNSVKPKRAEKKKRLADEKKYRTALKEELDHIDLLGSPDIESKIVKLEETFISLCISEYLCDEERIDHRKKMEELYDRHLTPERVMERAFQKYRLLLVIGDPGSGKTTLLKYYAVSCLNKIYRQFGFTDDVFPIYFPLRELDFEENDPVPLPQNLAKWSERHLLNISADQFHYWLDTRKTLVLLDGLDEISSKEQRRKVCKWVKDMCTGLTNAYFVVTSRATGYRKLDGIELKMPHLRADIMDFTLEQQADFLKKWFRAVYCAELPPVDSKMTEQEWKQQQKKRADQQSQAIIEFLEIEENKAIRELAAVPMLLQIMAIIWKKRQYIPKTRATMYDKALDYLLEYRDLEKNIEPLLLADESRRVLAPTALWMQEELQKDEAPKIAIHQKMQPILNTLDKKSRHPAVVFCDYLRDRTGVIADYDKDHYIFRHKSFREFLAGIRLKEEAHKQKRIKTLVQHFKEDWWEETLRFFMCKADDEIFDRFMRALFQSKVSKELDAHQQDLLQQLVMEAPQKRIDSLKQCLKSENLNNNQKRYVMDCLKIIGTPEAMEAIETFIENSKEDEANLDHARDIVWELTKETSKVEELAEKDRLVSKPGSIRNPFEDNVEYIKIPGGTYKYSVREKMETVPDLYLCKYPVTNKRYRRFITFLEGKEKKLQENLSLKLFADRFIQFAESIKGYSDYLGGDFKEWPDKLRSKADDNKKFNGDDQPVVRVSWYAARAYCFWLSCLEAVINRGEEFEKIKNIERWASIYRLPMEMEWEWAAGGEPDGSIREYPWPKEKGKPNDKLANYDGNVGATTTVGRYPEGATPHGLMD
ncbi:MAG: SUMF1/EgtB/PvdO family nonheme iron enzyme, partial [Candidatus Aminicenantes bacterium]|nr:SUMF1/EgtB/PvdO family nonheme iron enzyme [Candidatus Aminicenantes bacterium]NIN23107.1 SUMF1/EgtB/PvdO family nonheme iron enzyme [Candidatus Aminicenantes bacterium]NIN46834.1 SUMF1/EgtB/PvdO family nonheme iron enzyme [Candidatus Aminicenantes bacterium]NIN89756.1 SUMF1/EgtB/PvdO family nonheme iron enzyme [Candidatus Aminicenantes bacterium]NIO86299.1 SUMF1/EgtB/PvdO family nonheme iron enzyme [Candidatus Aminicenantes bacterium]